MQSNQAPMRVGIYNRWLSTLGGGEKHSLAIAEYLSSSYPVSVISHTPVQKDEAASRLNLDLSRVDFFVIRDRPIWELSAITKDYDFFLNASYMDFFPSEATHSATLIYFPTPIHFGSRTNIHRWMKLAIRRLLMVPSTDGVYSIEPGINSFLWLLEPTVKVWLPRSRRRYWVRFKLASRAIGVERVSIKLDGNRIASVFLPPSGDFVSFQFEVPGIDLKDTLELVLQVEGEEEIISSGGAVKMALTDFYIENPRYYFYHQFFEGWFNNWGLRLNFIPKQVSAILESLDSYDAIWANSEFTRKWIRKYWRRHSTVLYPPVDIFELKPGQKRNSILSVGRFFADGHNKKHPVMVQAFKEMIDQGLTDWELHLVGGTTPGAIHVDYLRHLYKSSSGYPITIHPDIQFDQLVKLYGESAIYWHASGYGEDENREPARFEHFGITTVEAMASGCVPVVIGKGGQPEIVSHGNNGFLWQSVGQLKDLTWKLIRNPSLCQRFAYQAIVDSQRFDKPHFRLTLQQLLSQIGVG